MKVGDVVWIKGEHAYAFYQQEVIAETSRSWIVMSPDSHGWMRQDPDRFGKKLPKSGNGWLLGSEEEAKMDLWAKENRWKIQSFVRGVTDSNVLLEVAKLIGYPNLPVSPTEIREEK